MEAILLFFTIVALLTFLGWFFITTASERKFLINRLIAKNASEVRILDRALITDEPLPRPEPITQEELDFWNDGEEVGI